MDHAAPVLEYWFGREPLTPPTLAARMGIWFGAGDASERDREIALRFGDLVERALAGELAAWAHSPRQRLALILLLDQFTRQAFRGRSRAFEGDAAAVALAIDGLQKGADAALGPAQRLFFYMPLQHCESADVQEESVAAYRRLAAEVPAELQPVFAGALDYAQRHRDIVARFGRFPHRNAALGRASTLEEQAWLASGGERFGQ
jgi:uncharacterized protein (DUF924 family)